jgi:hypothetical protein
MLSDPKKIALPSTKELPCSDDTPVDNEEQQRAEQEQQQQRAEKLAQYLRSIGIDPDNLPGN